MENKELWYLNANIYTIKNNNIGRDCGGKWEEEVITTTTSYVFAYELYKMLKEDLEKGEYVKMFADNQLFVESYKE